MRSVQKFEQENEEISLRVNKHGKENPSPDQNPVTRTGRSNNVFEIVKDHQALQNRQACSLEPVTGLNG